MNILEHIKNWPFLRRLLSKVPGPFLAKFTRLWKVWHLLRGTYKAKLQQLHALHGPLIQVAPREVSWQFSQRDRKTLRGLDKPDSRAADIIETGAAQSLRDCFQMERLNQNEHLINLCNSLLRCLLADAAQKQTPVDLANLLTRHAFDVMFSVTTGERAGFVDNIPNADKIYKKLGNWKFYAVLYGSYLRYHPIVKAMLPGIRSCNHRQATCDPALEILGHRPAAKRMDPDGHKDVVNGSEEHKSTCKGDVEARTALAIAGFDPAASLSREVIKHISADEQLQQLLHAELTSAGLTSNPSFQELSLRKLSLPRMHALIQHHMRLLGLHDIDLSYVSPAGGAVLGDHIVEAGHVVHMTSNHSSFAGVEIDSFEALDWSTAAEIQRNLPAYNLWQQDHALDDCHFLVVAKLLVGIIQHFDLSNVENGVKITVANKVNENMEDQQPSEEDVSSEDDKISDVMAQEKTSSGGASDTLRQSTVTPSDMDILGEHLGPAVTDELFRNFDPSSDPIHGNHILRVGPVKDRVARAILHETLQRIYGDLLQHKTDVDNIMHFATKQTKIKFNKQRNYSHPNGPRKMRYAVVRPWYKEGVKDRRPREVNQKWGGWATQEHQKSMDAQSEESYLRQQRANLVANASGAKAEPPKPTTFKETYKQTGGSNGTGPRKVLRVETTIHDGNGSITTSSDGVLLDQEVKAKVDTAPTTRPEGWVPPHMRARLERERQAAEAAELATQTPLPVSPEIEPSTQNLDSGTPTSSSDSPRSSPNTDRTDSPLDPLAPEFTLNIHSK
ncbi:hypothetical protein CKM354_000238600 [Cercospora kikuchii]|uniref:Uncharacterized protein n=1 Tax=Cercospora kikuchii TaxID=84275 RepID=A0A9P3C9Z0_9PEZI|nr:uncharacterized protein CKM354_000238600 [Cercospora kikuchii]GIZ38993.1 hypothetical protein CKM354_000238600 [Cercospora kikuchii]